MANATPPKTERTRADGTEGAPRIQKPTIEARQGRRGRHVLIILAVSLILITIAYVLLYFYQPTPPH
jgi:hypothetical protein